jgi:hypothetical protein
MTTKIARDLEKDLERLGFVYDRTNSKHLSFWIQESTGVEVKVPSGIDKSTAQNVLRIAQRRTGVPTKDNKRNAPAIRARNAAAHQEAAEALARIRAQMDVAAQSESRIRELEEQYREADRKFRYWDKLMRGVAA